MSVFVHAQGQKNSPRRGVCQRMTKFCPRSFFASLLRNTVYRSQTTVFKFKKVNQVVTFGVSHYINDSSFVMVIQCWMASLLKLLLSIP